jgi:hypothetical protein
MGTMQDQSKPRPYKVEPTSNGGIVHGVLLEDGLPVQRADATYKTPCGERVDGNRVRPFSFFNTDRPCRSCLEKIRIGVRLGNIQP